MSTIYIYIDNILIYGLQRQSIYYDKRQSERSKIAIYQHAASQYIALDPIYQLKTYDFTM
jgi:hypothetical protein